MPYSGVADGGSGGEGGGLSAPPCNDAHTAADRVFHKLVEGTCIDIQENNTNHICNVFI